MTQHQKMSYTKSVLRLIAAVMLLTTGVETLIYVGAFLGGAEILGILEEVRQDYGK